MTALGKVLRTTAFKLSAIYIVVFSVFSVVFVLYISYTANQLLAQQLQATIAAEIYGLADQYRSGGLPGIVDAIDQRSHQPGASLYLITDVNGRILAGNVSRVPTTLLNSSGAAPVTVPYERIAGDGGNNVAMVQVIRLPNGFRMLIGRDIGEREQFREIIGRALAWALALMIALALMSWFFVSRRVLKRIDSLSATSRRIMAGDLSGRLEMAGTGDEFDRLAESLNAMLDRIENLMQGLKDVSDNIAHDLKTPLTRLRNRVEAALASAPSTETYRDALQATIEESDQLIKTFNGLLMIARMEAGSQDGAMTEVEAGAVVRDVAELYEPAAEEKGVALTVDVPEPVTLTANRELLGQALSNLIDNALKYSTASTSGAPKVVLSAKRAGNHLVLQVPTMARASPRSTAPACSIASFGSKKAARFPAAASVSVLSRPSRGCTMARSSSATPSRVSW